MRNNTQENRKSIRSTNPRSTNDIKKTTWSKRHDNYYGFVKVRVAARSGFMGSARCFGRLLGRKAGPKVAFLKTLKIGNGT